MKKLLFVYAGFALGGVLGFHYAQGAVSLQETPAAPSSLTTLPPSTLAPTTTSPPATAPPRTTTTLCQTDDSPDDQQNFWPCDLTPEQVERGQRQNNYEPVPHCIADDEDGYMWTQGDPDYTTRNDPNRPGHKQACVG